jgi:L-aspartate oxidase
MHFDIIVVGSGAAGLSFVNYFCSDSCPNTKDASIGLFSKKGFNLTNTSWAQGGIAAVLSASDSFDSHIQDTLNAGANKNIEFIVTKVVREAPKIIEDLSRWGMPFDKFNNGEFKLTLEGGHSDSRIVHSKDATGNALQSTLENEIKTKHSVLKHENHQLIDVHKDSNDIFHLSFLDEKNNIFICSCSYLILATGGLGAIYSKTTNQPISTGDGIYFAKKLGTTIKDLAYIQFHPTGLYSHHETAYLVTEALRGQGAILKDLNNISFMEKYDPRGSLAPRDIVSRAIFNEMKIAESPFIYLDGTSIHQNIWFEHFPNLFHECKKMNIDPIKDLIPITPVQHYSCGGVYTDEFGETTVKGLYALGEVASTGLHGANRLASNSLLEAIAFAKFAAKNIIAQFEKKNPSNNSFKTGNIQIKKLSRSTLKKIMTESAGIERNNISMIEAIEELKSLKETALTIEHPQKVDIENNIIYEVGQDILKDALNKKENAGVHFNTSLLT